MLIEIYIIFQIVVIGLFFTAFFTKQEILWVLCLVLSGIMMYNSYSVEYYVYQFNTSIGAYDPVITNHVYPYLMGVNLIFMSLSLILGMFDLFDKYGTNILKQFKK
jgi:hypothetical protein